MYFHYEPTPVPGVCTDVAPGVRRLIANNPSDMTYHGTNTYLIETIDGIYVLDPGPAGDEGHADAVVSAFNGTPAGILLTHRHSDHLGLARQMAERLGVRIFASPPPTLDHFRPDIELRAGDLVSGLVVIETPGHARDHLCFARNDGVVFTGDHVMSWNSSVIVWPEGDMSAYYAHLERLIERGDKLYLPGHGPPLPDPVPYVRNLLDRRRQREDEIKRTLTHSGTSISSLAARLYGKKNPRAIWASERNVESHLRKLQGEGLAVELGDGRWALAKENS